MVDFELDISLEEFEVVCELFIEKIFKLLGVEVRIVEVIVVMEGVRRKKREIIFW